MIRPEPCFKCGARGSCGHRTVDDVVLVPVREVKTGQGNAHSPWGAHGNSCGKARQRIIEAMKLFEQPKERIKP